MTTVMLIAGLVGLCLAAILLARSCLPTHSITQVLYETEHPPKGGL